MLLLFVVSMVLVLLEVGAILGNGYGIQGHSIMMNVFQWSNG